MQRRKRNPRGRKGVEEGKVVSALSRRMNVPFALSGGFPDKARVRLKYVDIKGLSGIGVSQVYRGNGPFDPDQSGVGLQPYNYDDWSAQYNRVRCMGSTITLQIVSTGATYPLTQSIYIFAPRHTATSVIGSLTSLRDAMASPYAKYIVSNQLNSGNNEPRLHSHSMSTQEILGLDNSELLSDQYQSLVSTTPAHEWFWHTSSFPLDQSSSIASVITVTITYDLEFFDRNELGLDMLKARRDELVASRALYLEQKRKAKLDTVDEKKSQEPHPADEFIKLSPPPLKRA